jgi:hypothetical protein
LAALLLFLVGCSEPIQRAQRPAWREQAEKACMAEGKVRFSRYLQPRERPIDGPGICGLTQPLMVGALSDAAVQLDTVATLDCPMVAALDTWIAQVVQPVAQARFNSTVVQIDTMGSYSCRTMNGGSGSHISEHAFGNALDVAGFRLADGRRITVVHDWTQGDEQSQAFLRDVHAGACNTFTTVLGPGYNVFHYNHIHVDLAMHGSASRGFRHYCKPVPEASRPGPSLDPPPEVPPTDEEMDVASSRVPSGGESQRGMVANAPPPYEAPPRVITPGNATAYSPVPAHGSFRDDGAFQPEGNPNDWDITSSIKPRQSDPGASRY